ncbi:MAG: helix-turn-helix transcriptional regulator [Candidatus Galacturonibacter soehngenii]|nr:helix-turn-helix transcriptional regulator [Candidatus Galacturonibacter soehngenii]
MNKESMKTITYTELIFKKNIKNLRKSLPGCLSKADVAKKIGISASYYRNIENENISKYPSFEVLEKISDFYNVPVWKLFYKK